MQKAGFSHDAADIIHTVSLVSSCSSLTIKIMSNLDKIVGMKSIFSPPFVSSQRPYTLLAAANTEQREFRVVVMPACIKDQEIA